MPKPRDRGMAIKFTKEQKLQFNELMAAIGRADDREWRRLVDRADPVVARAGLAEAKADLARGKARLAAERAQNAAWLATLPLHWRLRLGVYDRVWRVRLWWLIRWDRLRLWWLIRWDRPRFWWLIRWNRLRLWWYRLRQSVIAATRSSTTSQPGSGLMKDKRGRVILTPQQVQAIRSHPGGRGCYRKLAAEYGIGMNHISMIRRRKRWGPASGTSPSGAAGAGPKKRRSAMWTTRKAYNHQEDSNS
jgi:hypothetical protein